MEQKQVSQLDAEGFFSGVAMADESPLEPGVFLLPGGAIDRDPPKQLEEGKRYKPWGKGWRAEDIPKPEEPVAEPVQPVEVKPPSAADALQEMQALMARMEELRKAAGL